MFGWPFKSSVAAAAGATSTSASTYSIDSHPEMFAPLHLVADALIEHLAQTYDVQVSRDASHADDFLRHPQLLYFQAWQVTIRYRSRPSAESQ